MSPRTCQRGTSVSWSACRRASTLSTSIVPHRTPCAVWLQLQRCPNSKIITGLRHPRLALEDTLHGMPGRSLPPLLESATLRLPRPPRLLREGLRRRAPQPRPPAFATSRRLVLARELRRHPSKDRVCRVAGRANLLAAVVEPQFAHEVVGKETALDVPHLSVLDVP